MVVVVVVVEEEEEEADERKKVRCSSGWYIDPFLVSK